MNIRVRIRGVYATALTQLLLSRGFEITDPSRVIEERFGTREGFRYDDPSAISIRDRRDCQGIVLSGNPRTARRVAGVLQHDLYDAICRNVRSRDDATACEVEFPSRAKSILDALRNEVVPTLPNHHRMRIIEPEYLDMLEESAAGPGPGSGTTPDTHEQEPASSPGPRRGPGDDRGGIARGEEATRREDAARSLEERIIRDSYEAGALLRIEHVKPDGAGIDLSPGRIVRFSARERKLTLQRGPFSGSGHYDGLDIPKEAGDYATTEIREGDWSYRHDYYRTDGAFLGSYFNINTPIEYYPGRVRYVDLEIDVVEYADGRRQVVDSRKLEEHCRRTRLTPRLRDAALREADEIVQGR